MIKYSKITTEDIPAVAQHLLKCFYAQEPFGLALGLTIDQVEPWFPKFIDQVLHYYERVSYIARDKDTNEIVGTIVNIIMADNRVAPPSMMSHVNKTTQPVKWQICQFLSDLEEGVNPMKELGMNLSEVHKYLVCYYLCVLPQYSGKGIAKTLIQLAEDDAKQNCHGVSIAMTDVTSDYSFRAFQKLGYNHIVKVVKYLDYKDPDGVPIFEGREEQLGVHTHARVLLKRL